MNPRKSKSQVRRRASFCLLEGGGRGYQFKNFHASDARGPGVVGNNPHVGLLDAIRAHWLRNNESGRP